MGCAVLAVSAAHRRRGVGTAVAPLTWLAPVTLLALLTCLALLGGCSRVIGGTPMPAGGHPTGTVAGQPATDGPTGPEPKAPDATTPVIGTDGGSADRLANSAVADLNDYWEHAFPEAFPGKEFAPATTLTSYDSRGPDAVLCGRHTAGQAGAFTCPDDGGLVWDRGRYLPELNRSAGPIGTATALAHEMGHAVQRQAGADAASPLVREQRADCFTGAFFRHATEDRAQHFRVSTGDGLNRAMGALPKVRDAADPASGRSPESTQNAAMDRVDAFRGGFERGPASCAGIDAADVGERSAQAQFRRGARETDLPISAESVDAVGASLREVFRDTGAAPPAIVPEPRPCGALPFRGPTSYCPGTDTVSMDLRQLRHIARSPDGRGDFAAIAQVASRYAQSLQQAAGFPLDDESAGMRTACVVGSWSGLLVDDPAGRRNPAGELRITPGDLNEGVTSLLSRDDLIAADLDGRQPPAGFARVEAFRAGFEHGLEPCTTKYA